MRPHVVNLYFVKGNLSALAAALSLLTWAWQGTGHTVLLFLAAAVGACRGLQSWSPSGLELVKAVVGWWQRLAIIADQAWAARELLG